MDPLSTSVAILQQHRVPLHTYQVGYTKLFFRGQVDVLENLRLQVLDGTHEVVHGPVGGRVLLDFDEIKSGILTLQSFVRGENARRQHSVLKKLNDGVAPTLPDKHLKTIVHIQSVVRGWLAQRYFCHLQRWKKLTLDSSRRRQRSRSRNLDSKDFGQENKPILPQNVEELQRRVVNAESSASVREHENTALREQIRLSETRWSKYETKMKVVEEMWQCQMATLQVSLTAAKKTLGSYGHQGRPYGSPSPNYYDSEDDVSAIQTPIQMTPARTIGNYKRETNGVTATVTVDNLSKEFEQTKQNFDNEAKTFIEVSPEHGSKQIEDYRILKKNFETWKKEYKYRLREAKAQIGKGVSGESGVGCGVSGGGGGRGGGDRRSRHWWGKLSKKNKERMV